MKVARLRLNRGVRKREPLINLKHLLEINGCHPSKLLEVRCHYRSLSLSYGFLFNLVGLSLTARGFLSSFLTLPSTSFLTLSLSSNSGALIVFCIPKVVSNMSSFISDLSLFLRSLFFSL
ncbi:hypothetical protein AMTRI_Chr05g69520 [Amborella trichopoda]